jgi:hypothetical protein
MLQLHMNCYGIKFLGDYVARDGVIMARKSREVGKFAPTEYIQICQ